MVLSHSIKFGPRITNSVQFCWGFGWSTIILFKRELWKRQIWEWKIKELFRYFRKFPIYLLELSKFVEILPIKCIFWDLHTSTHHPPIMVSSPSQLVSTPPTRIVIQQIEESVYANVVNIRVALHLESSSTLQFLTSYLAHSSALRTKILARLYRIII